MQFGGLILGSQEGDGVDSPIAQHPQIFAAVAARDGELHGFGVGGDAD